nr:hypothetical protein [Janthinobacterium sp. Marseille]
MKSIKLISNPTTRNFPGSVGIIKNGVTGQQMQPITRGQSGQGSSNPKPENGSK